MGVQNNCEKIELRKKAEELLKAQPERLEKLDPEEIQNVLHELQVQRIELEIRNEELRNTQKVLEDVRNRYFRLYHSASVGYVVLDPSGIIKQTNSTFIKMLSVDEDGLKGKAFADLLVEEDANIFRARFKTFLKHPSGKSMESRIRTGRETFCHVRLEALPNQESDHHPLVDYNELLMTVSDITEQKLAKIELETALNETRTREEEIAALLKGARAVLEQENFQTTARKIFDACRDLIGATSGYVAMLSADGAENELLFLESGGMPCNVHPDLPMPIRGLRELAYRDSKVVYHNDFMNSNWVDFMPEGHMALTNVLFSPLVLNGKTVGIIGIANKESDFNDRDARIAAGFGELAAIALQNSRNLEERIHAEREREKVIEDLKTALSNVKQLSGLLPICAHCKKIRDDQGYWNRLEAYIEDHSEAELSHSICPDCLTEHYSEFFSRE